MGQNNDDAALREHSANGRHEARPHLRPEWAPHLPTSSPLGKDAVPGVTAAHRMGRPPTLVRYDGVLLRFVAGLCVLFGEHVEKVRDVAGGLLVRKAGRLPRLGPQPTRHYAFEHGAGCCVLGSFLCAHRSADDHLVAHAMDAVVIAKLRSEVELGLHVGRLGKPVADPDEVDLLDARECDALEEEGRQRLAPWADRERQGRS